MLVVAVLQVLLRVLVVAVLQVLLWVLVETGLQVLLRVLMETGLQVLLRLVLLRLVLLQPMEGYQQYPVLRARLFQNQRAVHQGRHRI